MTHRYSPYCDGRVVTQETNNNNPEIMGDSRAQQTLNKICEIEEYYQTLAAEVDERSISLSSAEFLSKTFAKGDNRTPASRDYNTTVYAVRDAWQWTIESARCMQIHLRNAALYHQFFSEIKHYDQCLKQVSVRLHSAQEKTKGKTSEPKSNDVSKLTKEIKEVLQQMLDIEAKVVGLFTVSGDVVPVHLRKEPVATPLKVIALVTCTSKEIPVQEGEECLLLDNSEVTKWKIKNSKGQEGFLPAIVCLIPPPDRAAILASIRLRQELMTTWKETLQIAKQHARKLMMQHYTLKKSKELHCLNQSQRADIVHCIEDFSSFLAPEDHDHPGYVEFREKSQEWAEHLESMKGTSPDGKTKSGPLLTQWSTHKKLLRQLQEFETFAGAYEESVIATRESQNFLVRDDHGHAKYVSKAYIERMLPMEIEEPPTSDSPDSNTRHMTLSEKVPSILDTEELSQTVTDISFEEETMSLQTIKETQTFVIKGVIDPRDNKEISIYQAIGDGIINQTKGIYFNPETGQEMAIPEAMNRGLILVEFSNKTLETSDLIRTGVIRSTTTSETISYSIQSVVDPVTGQRISVAEAIEKGIVDQETGKYVNPLTGSTMSITSAIDRGLVDVEEVCEEAVVEPKESALPEMSPDLAVVGVKDPKTGKILSLQDAIKKGIIDPETGLYRTPSGELIPMADAVKSGLLQVKLANPDEDPSNLLPPAVLSVLKNDMDAIEDLILPSDVDCVDAAPMDINQSVYDKLKPSLNTDLSGVHDPVTGKNLTIGEAFEDGVLKMDPLQVVGDGTKFPLQDAALQGLVEPQALREILGVIEPLGIDKLFEDSVIDANTGEYVDPRTGERMSLAEAIARGKLDPDQVFLRDLNSGAIMSLSSAIDSGKINPETGRVIDPTTGLEMKFADAIGNHVIDPSIDAEKLASQICALKMLNDHTNPKQLGVKNPLTGDSDTLEEAILNGTLDLPNGNYVNLATGETMSIPEAVEKGLIDPKAAKEILEAMDQNSLGKLIEDGLIDPNTGKFIDPKTGEKMSIKDAIDRGLLDPCNTFVVDPETGKVVSLDSLIKDGKFDPATGKFKDPLTNLEISMKNAIKKGIVKPRIDAEDMVEEKMPVKDLLSNGKTNPAELMFQAPDGSTMPLKTALAEGYLTPDSQVKIDPKTGMVIVAGDEELIKALMNTKKSSDWLAGIESMMAGQDSPLETAEDLEKQISSLENLKKSMEQRQPSMNSLLEKAKGLLDNNKNPDGNPGVQQQCQRLRFNSSDLKVRMDTVNTHLDKRLDKLHRMHGDLDTLYEDLESFEGWMDTADEEMKIFKISMTEGDRPEVVTRSFEDFNEGVLAKENDLQALNKAGRKLQDIVQDYDKDAKDFQRTLPNKPEFQTAQPPSGLKEPVTAIQKELDATNDRYKKVVGDCAALMDKLSDTAAKNKRFNQLKNDLEEALPALKEDVGNCHDEVQQGSDPQEQLEGLNAVTANVIAKGKEVEDLKKVGQELVDILEELDCKNTPKAHEIQETMDAIQGEFDEIQEEVVDKQHKLNAAVAQSKDVGHNLAALLGWVDEVDQIFNEMKPVSLDRETLTQQIQAHKVVTADIENHRPQVDTVVEQCQEQPGTSDEAVNELLDRFDNLISRSEDRGTELEDVVQKLGNLHNNVHQLESWLAGAVHSLKRESSDFDHDSLKNKIENLYQHKQGKQKDLDNIKSVGKELIDDPRTGDKHYLRETLADVQGKWHDLTELLVQMISFAALREIDDLLKYLDKAENEINTAEPISTDPETLAVQLRDHKVFHEDLEAKRKAVNTTIDKCNKMLRETTNEEADDIKNKLDTIRNQADLVCKLSSERLAVLEEALPLASHFSETHADLQSWLGEIEAEIDSLDVPAESNVEQVKKQQDNAKTTQRIIEDHKHLVEDLVNTGHELMALCTDEDAADIKEDIENVTGKHEEVKAAIREKLRQLDDAFRNVTTDVGDTVDGLLEEMHYLSDQMQYADPVSANRDTLKDQIAENNAIIEDLDRRQEALQSCRDEVARALELESPETAEDCEDLRTKLQDLDKLTQDLRENTAQRDTQLREALEVADKYHKDYHNALQALRDIQDNLHSQDSPGVDPATVQEQQKELQAIMEDLQAAQQPIATCQQMAEQLGALCGVHGNMEIERQIEDINNLLEEIQDGVTEREEELASALDKAERFDDVLQAINSWLPKAEDKLEHMAPVAADPRSVRIQIEELKVFKIQTHPRYVDIQNLNQFASDLKNASPVTAESLTPQVKDINNRWNELLKKSADRETALKDALVELGELDHTVEEVLGLLQQTETDLQQLEFVYGDPKYIETHLKKIQMVQKDLANQEPVIRKLCKAIDKVAERTGNKASPLVDKKEEMLDMYRAVQVMARDKQNQLHDILKEVKAFMGEVEDDLRWLNNFRAQLKSSTPMGALPDTAQKEYDTFMNQYRELEKCEEAVKTLLLNGEDMLARCREDDGRQLRENLNRLQTRCYDTRNKAEKRRRKLEQHLQNVQDFHAMLKLHTDWLSNAEKILASFKYPSKLVDRVSQQIQDHKDFRLDVDAHHEIMQNLDRTGTYLKYFGCKQDTVYIKNLLISIKLRWKKLVRRTDEKGRLLQQAYKEDKRFYDAWKSLFDWLDTNEKKMKKFASAPAKVKQDIDELRNFQHQLGAKHPVYYSTMRLGRALKDRCVKSDPEREIMNQMLEDLKNKWSVIRSIVSQRQNKLDEALLSSGRVSDALASLLEWLGKAESYLAEDQPILGDLDTVNILIEQHKAFQQELESRQGMVQLMRASTGDPSVNAQLDELGTVWEKVNHLSDIREAKLQEALRLAEEFNEVVQVIRDWLPQAEAELKFRALPEDEESIVQLIESHEKFQESLRAQQPNIEKIRFMAEEILQSCHPNAVRFVKYYLTITQTRWEQALNRSNQRSVRLQEAMRSIRGNAALLEDLLAWLTEAQALLNAKEKDPIPEDLTVVEALVKEHLEFHEDLSNKNKDAERLTKLISPSNKKHLHGSQYKLNEVEAPSPRVTTLQNKWRNVWRVSVDRKKKLQDALDHLLELESFKNFDFDLWRQRYISWIRAKKFRITDFFRRQDKDNDGAVTRKEFVEGMLVSKFPSNRTELNAVFDIFDRRGTGLLDYQEFVEALRPERQRTPRARPGSKKPVTETELITDEIEQQVSHCQCRTQFKATKVGEGKYKFGDKGKMCLVRFLNSTVMVRVGGGWVTLAEFLESNDPCRAKGRTNTELREQFILPEGAAQTRAHFTNKRRASTPTGGLNAKFSGSASSLTSLGRSSAASQGLSAKNKHGHMARSWANLSQGTGGSRVPSLNDRRHGLPKSPMSPSPVAQSTPRRGTIHTPTPASTRSRVASSAKKESAANGTNGKTTPSLNDRASSSGSRTPNSLRSRSPASRGSAKSPTPRKMATPRQNMRF